MGVDKCMKQLNIVGTIDSSSIIGDFPRDAQYAHRGHVSGAISKFYKWKTINWNDGTSTEVLHYWSEQGGWYPSNYNVNGKMDTLELYELVYSVKIM